MKLYLIGGGDIKSGELEGIDKTSLAEARNRRVYILDLTSNDKEKLSKYREFLTSYFTKIGAEKVGFVSTANSLNEIKKEIKQSGLIYIPGGDTETLMNNLKKRNLGKVLKSFESILVGNSAGALAICREIILTKDEDVVETRVLNGLGLVPFSVDVHYDKTHDKELFELSKERDIYGIPERCAIVYDRKLDFIGDVWRFSKGKKEKVN
jgi:peptidase E